VLEGGIIILEYRTVILRSDFQNSGVTRERALNVVTVSAVSAATFALVVCAAVAIPLHVLSKDFNNKTAIVIEGISKIVAAISILQLSIKIPNFFGLYYRKSQLAKIKNGEPLEGVEDVNVMSLRSIKFNVAWNIWREVAECGVFLIPFFLTGDDVMSIPLSAVVGIVVGGLICIGINYANQRMKNTTWLTFFTVSLLVLLSTGLYSGGSHKLEMAYGSTPIAWSLEGNFWDSNRLPMTVLKPFGYSDTRTVLQIASFWTWLLFSVALHYRKWRLFRKPSQDEARTDDGSSSVGELILELPEQSEVANC
jgi:high-affinity iron transporter